MDLSSVTRRPSSDGSTRSRESAATSWTTFASIGMAQLREGGQDFLRPGPPEFHRQLRALPESFAPHHHTFSELRMTDADTDRAPARALGISRAGRSVAHPARQWPRHGPRLPAHPLEAVLRDLMEETRRAATDRIPRAPKGGVEEVDVELRPCQRHIEQPAFLL